MSLSWSLLIEINASSNVFVSAFGIAVVVVFVIILEYQSARNNGMRKRVRSLLQYDVVNISLHLNSTEARIIVGVL